jgi:hypothetical protein
MARDENVVTGINNASPTEIVGYYYPTGSSGSSYWRVRELYFSRPKLFNIHPV